MDAADISARALARARNAVYSRNSFRGKDLAFRERYFRIVPTRKERAVERADYELNPDVRQCVRFHHANLLGDSFFNGQPPYDFIFCRNLLIYFDRATQVRALGKLEQLLKPEGVLFVGPAELPLVAGNGFTSINLPMVFACRKAPAQHITVRNQKPRSHRPETPRVPVDLPQRAVSSRPEHEFAARVTDLAVARQLADAGRFEEATAICENHVRKEGPTAQAYYLMGLLRDAMGDSTASDYYRKALYLEPNHYETLLQMSLLLEKRGDHAGANAFKRRAERAHNAKG
jgi:chemotaxis protein methyltransferase WspC